MADRDDDPVGPAQIVVRTPDGAERTLGYTVKPKRYVEQRLTVSPRTVVLVYLP